MPETDKYHKCSDEDPDLITGIHGDDPIILYSELCEVVEDVIKHFKRESRSLPKIRLMQEVA